jgi:hypothetical protein
MLLTVLKLSQHFGAYAHGTRPPCIYLNHQSLPSAHGQEVFCEPHGHRLPATSLSTTRRITWILPVWKLWLAKWLMATRRNNPSTEVTKSSPAATSSPSERKVFQLFPTRRDCIPSHGSPSYCFALDTLDTSEYTLLHHYHLFFLVVDLCLHLPPLNGENLKQSSIIDQSTNRDLGHPRGVRDLGLWLRCLQLQDSFSSKSYAHSPRKSNLLQFHEIFKKYIGLCILCPGFLSTHSR